MPDHVAYNENYNQSRNSVLSWNRLIIVRDLTRHTSFRLKPLNFPKRNSIREIYVWLGRQIQFIVYPIYCNLLLENTCGGFRLLRTCLWSKFLENRELIGKFRKFLADQLDLAWYLLIASESWHKIPCIR
jgi:hypothetical protein